MLADETGQRSQWELLFIMFKTLNKARCVLHSISKLDLQQTGKSNCERVLRNYCFKFKVQMYISKVQQNYIAEFFDRFKTLFNTYFTKLSVVLSVQNLILIIYVS
jgi:hypothetical protein